MPAEATNFHESPKPGIEFEIIDPDDGIDAVYCCKCWNEGYCAAEMASSDVVLVASQMVAYWLSYD